MIGHTLKLDLGEDRHLVVGDLHGQYEVFLRLLDNVNYDPAKDVIYCVGDVIDRGPDVVKLVEFFENTPRCYTVKGNHEHMALRTEWVDTWLGPAGGGLVTLTDLDRHGRTHEWLKDIIRPWPWVIDVGEDNEEHAFRIVHAEMPAMWSEEYFQRVLSEALNADYVTFAPLIWSRKLVELARENLNHLRPAGYNIEFHADRYRQVFAGHTPNHKAIKCGDHWFIDTMDTRRPGHITMIDAITHERYTEKYR